MCDATNACFAAMASFDDFMKLLGEMGESRDGVVAHVGSEATLNMVPRKKHPVVEHAKETPEHPAGDSDDTLHAHQRDIDQKLSSIVDLLKRNCDRKFRVDTTFFVSSAVIVSCTSCRHRGAHCVLTRF